MAPLDVSYHERHRAERMQDPEFRREYESARAQIEQIDNVIRELDALRTHVGLSKAQLARLIGKDPATLRRLFTAEVNPELKTIAALANALDADVRIVPRNPGRQQTKPGSSKARAGVV